MSGGAPFITEAGGVRLENVPPLVPRLVSCQSVAGLDDGIAKGTSFKQLRMTVNESDHVMTTKDQAYMQQIGMVIDLQLKHFQVSCARS